MDSTMNSGEVESVIKQEPPTLASDAGLGPVMRTNPGTKAPDIVETSASEEPRVEERLRRADFNNSQLQRSEKEDLKRRVAFKTSEISKAKKFLKTFPDWLHPSERLIPEILDWVDDIDAIFKHNELPRVVLGFMGPSGCGKSSVINALLDYEELLPCNCTEACTAVAVEISWNTSNEKASGNRAVIQFMTAEEWKEELQNLVTVLLSLEPEARLDPVDDDTRIASTKIKNVYPDYDLSTLTEQSVTELMNDSVVAKSLGQNLVIEKPPGKEKQFAAAIAPYIDSSPKAVTVSGRSKKKTPYWPLVKVVKIYTKARVLETGLVLVDLPGSGDANIAREMVAEEYMSQVSAICILADIKRALTNKVAKDLFGRGFALKRRLLRGNLLHEERTFFVLTCTDVINNRQVINQQGLESSPDVRQLLEVQEGIITRRGEIFNETENLNTRNAQRSKIMKDISKNIQASQSRLNKRKRKQPADDMQASPAPEIDLNSALNRLQNELQNRVKAQQTSKSKIEGLIQEDRHLQGQKDFVEHRLTTLCVRARNSFVAHRMASDFSNGLNDLEAELIEVDDDAASSVPKPEPSCVPKGVHTFCVCSKALQKMQGRFVEEKMPPGFDTMHDTQLPQLFWHCMDFTLGARERLADEFLADLSRLRVRMRGWADNTNPDKVVTKRERRLLGERIQEQSNVLQESGSSSIDIIGKTLETHVQGLNQKSFHPFVQTAARGTPEVFNKWVIQIHSGATWKAICRRNGVHTSKSKGADPVEHNWNDDLAEVLTRLVDKRLDTLFNKVMPETQNAYLDMIERLTEKFPEYLERSCDAVTKNVHNALQNFLHTSKRLETELLRNAKVRFETACTMGRVIDRQVPPKVRGVMKPVYLQGFQMAGPGSVKARKELIAGHLEKVSGPMYMRAARQITESVENIVCVLLNALKKDLDEYIEKIQAEFEKMLEHASATPRPETGPEKIKMQREVLEKLSAFDGLLGEYDSNDVEPAIEEDPFRLDDVKVELKDDDCDSGDDEASIGGDAVDDVPQNFKIDYEAFSDEE